ncbi:MAG: hypothetical protein OHK0023_01000 [Anaerolineae bacterium]
MEQKPTYEGRITGWFILIGIVIIILVPLSLVYTNLIRDFLPSLPDLRAQKGFMGTGASLASDISLLAYVILLIPLMLYGYWAARRQLFNPHHKTAMTLVTLINWGVIAYLMAVSYSGAVPFYSQNDPNKIIIPTIHLITGGIAQILGTVNLIRMWFEYRLPSALRYEPIKPQMRLTLLLWIITALLGISIYITWYGVPFQPRTTAPVTTPEPGATPEATQDGANPAATADPAATAAPTEAATPAATEDVTPEATEAPAPAATEEATPAATQSN